MEGLTRVCITHTGKYAWLYVYTYIYIYIDRHIDIYGCTYERTNVSTHAFVCISM